MLKLIRGDKSIDELLAMEAAAFADETVTYLMIK